MLFPETVRRRESNIPNVQTKNAALQVVQSLFFAYFEEDAAIRLNELSGGKSSPYDLDRLRDYCIDGLHQYVEEKIEKYLDDKATGKFDDDEEDERMDRDTGHWNPSEE